MSATPPGERAEARPAPITPLPRRPLPRRASLLPRPLSSLVGRGREIADVRDILLLPETRLLTLTGPGGVGKTRLALRVAEGVVSELADGVAFVALASVVDIDVVAPTIARALEVRERGEESLVDRLIDYFGSKRLLLVLDNFEQVVEAAPLVTDLLAACPHLKVMVSSRVRLRLSGEHEYVVPPLRMPAAAGCDSRHDAAGSEAVRLFVERARAVSSAFTLTDDTASSVAAICRRLDGLPLAIELAAARSKVLPPAALLARLERRLPLLTGGGRDEPARQRTMRDTIAWSHDLLSPAEQRLYRCLAVFVGGFSMEAAEAVVLPEVPEGDVFEGIASLVDQSLLLQAEGSDAGPRFFMLETVREDAMERLAASGEEDVIRHRHAAYFLGLGEARAGVVPRRAWLERMEREHDNLRTVLGWAIGRGEAAIARRLIAAIWLYFWCHRGYLREGRVWAERARLLGPGSAPGVYAAVLFAASEFARQLGDLDGAVAAAGEALAGARASGNDLLTGMALHHFANAIGIRDGMDTSQPLREEARALLKDAVSVDERRTAAQVAHNLAIEVSGRGDRERAEALAAEALVRWRELASEDGAAITLTTLAMIARERGDRARAASLAQQALQLCWERRDKLVLIDALRAVASTANLDRGQAAPVARLWGAADALVEEIGVVVPREEQTFLDGDVAGFRAALGEDAFAAARAAGRALPLEQAVAEALAHLVPVDDPRGAPAANQGLTPRELEVVRLIVEGRSNQEIADALGISLRTATTHVGNVLNKLGLDSRTAIAAWAIRGGLA